MSNISATECWSCKQASTSMILCDYCHVIQPPIMRDYFALFALDVSFLLDTHTLEKRYLDLQITCHPDRFTHASHQEREYAYHHTLALNEAYETLKDPTSRARYMLSLHDISLEDGGSVTASHAILLSAMELQETIELTETISALVALQAHINDLYHKATDAFTTQYQEKRYEEAAQEAIFLRYLSKAQENCQEKIHVKKTIHEAQA